MCLIIPTQYGIIGCTTKQRRYNVKEYFRYNFSKENFRNMVKGVSKAELVYWWILRGLMIFALVYTLIVGHGIAGEYKGSSPWQQVAANLVGMFAYEIIQIFFPKNSKFRLMSARFQDITALGFLLGSFGGAFCNFYYSIPMYDKILHATGTAEAVYVGYELVCATQLQLKKTCPKQIARLTALGFGFVLATGWELFEFICDQFFGFDAQHWNVQNALDGAGGDWQKVFLMFKLDSEELFMQRFSLMDTMSDIVMNFIGGFIMFFILIAIPYRHKGKNNINVMIDPDYKD